MLEALPKCLATEGTIGTTFPGRLRTDHFRGANNLEAVPCSHAAIERKDVDVSATLQIPAHFLSRAIEKGDPASRRAFEPYFTSEQH